MSENRKLGDEWIGWSGSEENPSRAEYNEGKGVFVFFASLTCIFYILLIAVTWFMVMPRFEQFGGFLHNTFFIFFAVILGFSIVFSLLVITSMGTGLRLPFRNAAGFVLYRYVLDGALKWSKIFGISRDRLGSSFIKVSNSINAAEKLKIKGNELLILLPRCLEKSVRENIIKISESYGCVTSVVSGGEAARRKIFEMKPAAVLGIACERDLLSGIQDTAVHLPVFGIANKRPEGPCMNTLINITELEEKLSSICINHPASD